MIIKREMELIMLAFQATEKAGGFVNGHLDSYEGFGMRRDRKGYVFYPDCSGRRVEWEE